MPEKWQQWYSHNIDDWQASAAVQSFTDAAYRAFHNLLMAQFESADGMLEPSKLAKLSRMGVRWEEVRPGYPTIAAEVMEEFESGPEGKVYNARMFREWQIAKEKFYKGYTPPEEVSQVRSEAGKRGAEARWGKTDGKPDGKEEPFAIQTMANDGLHTHTHTHTHIPIQVPKANTPAPRSNDRAAAASQIPHMQDAEPPEESIAAAAANASRESAVLQGRTGNPSLPMFISLPLNAGEHTITEADVARWSALYPAVDVRQELRKMVGWCEGNPRSRKTRSGIARFINHWLSNAQDRSSALSDPRRNSGTNQQHPQGAAVGRVERSSSAFRAAAQRSAEEGPRGSSSRHGSGVSGTGVLAGDCGDVPTGIRNAGNGVRAGESKGSTASVIDSAELFPAPVKGKGGA